MTSSASGPVTYNTGANPWQMKFYVNTFAHGCDNNMMAQATVVGFDLPLWLPGFGRWRP